MGNYFSFLKMSDQLNDDQSEVGNQSEHENNVENLHLQPLLLPEILKAVFKHLGRNELKECRLVCKTWNKATIPFTRDEFMVRIYGNTNVPYALHTIENFVDIFRSNNLGIPFARFQLGSFCTTEGVGKEFLELCGDTIQDIDFLEYSNNSDFKVEDLSELLKSTQKKLEIFCIPIHLQSSAGNIVKLFPEESEIPRLKSLKEFKLSWNSSQKLNKFCPTFLEEVITNAPNISSLTLYESEGGEGEEGDLIFSSSFEVLTLIEKLGREQSIQHIKILLDTLSNSRKCGDLLVKMAAKRNGLKLKTLAYNLCYYKQDNHPILQAIPFFKDTLESLDLYHGSNFTVLKEFPRMPHLTSLSLSVSGDLDSNTKCINLCKIFPVLEHLTVRTWGDHLFDEFFPESDPCPNIKTLESELSFNLKSFNQMLTVLPNLTKLAVKIDEDDGEEILRQIWTRLTQLDSLYLSGRIRTDESMDTLLTGISCHALCEIEDIVDYLNFTSEVERSETILELRNEHCQLPSISNLTKLKSLGLFLDLVTLDGEVAVGSCELKYLTDFTGYLGLYPIKTLTNLEIAYCGCDNRCEMTKTCREILAKDMGLKIFLPFEKSKYEVISCGFTGECPSWI